MANYRVQSQRSVNLVSVPSQTGVLAQMFDYDGWMEGVTAERLAGLVAAAPGPPMVVAQTSTGQSVPAALLAWGRAEAGWMAGIAFLAGGGERRAVITMWAAATSVRQVARADYSRVPRVRLTGRPEVWPRLPPRYPNTGDDWPAAHLHLDRRDHDDDASGAGP